MPPQWIIPEGSPYSRGPSLRLDSLAALILDGRWRWVRQAVQASSASYGESCRPIGTSNGAGSRADSSRGPWSSAELAPRPVRRGRSKPQKNALDSRKMRGMQSWIPGSGKGLILGNGSNGKSDWLIAYSEKYDYESMTAMRLVQKKLSLSVLATYKTVRMRHMHVIYPRRSYPLPAPVRPSV